MGKEGRAAVRAADFAFAKFKFLQKIILVHGHWYYHRVSMLVHYFFYKNVACFGGQLFLQFINNFSIQTLYDSFNLTFYNIFWTSLPIFIFGLLEQNLKSKALLKNPVLYKRLSKNYLLTLREFCLWFLYGLWHTAAIFYSWYFYFYYALNITSKGNFMKGKNKTRLIVDKEQSCILYLISSDNLEKTDNRKIIAKMDIFCFQISLASSVSASVFTPRWWPLSI